MKVRELIEKLKEEDPEAFVSLVVNHTHFDYVTVLGKEAGTLPVVAIGGEIDD